MIESVLNRFKNSIKRGTGEAILILKQYPALDCREVIINASINNLAYDPQIEGSREVYLFELIELSAEKEAITEALIQHLLLSKDDDWGILQVFSLVGLMAKQGNGRAKEAIYQRYTQNLNPDFPFVDTSTPIGLDGYEGLRFIAEIKGKMLLDDPDEREDDYLLRYAKEELPNMDVEKQLAEDALQNQYIRAYIQSVKKLKESRAAYSRVNHDYTSLKKVIAEGGKVPLSVGKKLSQADLQALAFDLVVETDEAKLNQYLRIFAFVAFPLAFDHLFPYLNHPDSDIVFRAIQALRHFKDEHIRQMAIENLSQPNFDSDYLELLVENYQPEDCGLIERVLSTIQDEEMFHSAGTSALKIFEKHFVGDCLALLVDIYNRGSCGHCREGAIEIMLKNNTLPAYIQEEGLYDSSIDIRKLLQSGANNKS